LATIDPLVKVSLAKKGRTSASIIRTWPIIAAIRKAMKMPLTGDYTAFIYLSDPFFRNALENGHPVVLGVRLHATWWRPEINGRIGMPATGSRDFGGHAVLIVGHRDNHFIVQNSWGSDWGDGGFGDLPEQYVENFGIAAWSLAL